MHLTSLHHLSYSSILMSSNPQKRASRESAHLCTFLVRLTLGFVLALPGTSNAQSPSSPPDTTQWIESSWTALPSLFYSPRTKLGGGGSVRYFPKRPAGARPTNIQLSAIYTARRQMVLSLVPDIYFQKRKRRLFLSALYLDFPDRFYGIGNDTRLADSESYTSQIASFLLSGEQEFIPNLSLGLQTWIRHERVKETEEDGLIVRDALRGGTSGLATGIGVFFRWDTRNNFFYTLFGTYVRGSWMSFTPTLGSDYSFSRATIDVRRFIPIHWRYVIALRSYNQAVTGEAPFQLLPQIGGRLLMRGYPEGRFRENVLSVVQAEFRAYIWGPIGAVLFGSVGDVQRRVETIAGGKLLATGGGGLRFLVNDEGLNFRIDYGIGRDGGSFYFTLGEAF